MRTFSSINDPVFVKKQSYNFIDRFFLERIRDERDLPFVYLKLKILFFHIPFAIFLFTPVLTGWVWWVAALAWFLVGAVLFIGAFTLMLHNTSHRKFYKQKYDWMNYMIPWVFGPFFGQSPETYFGHHIGMHHSENNLKDDRSSTMYYQRDSLIDFFKYYGSFIAIGIIELVDYFKSKNKPKFVKMVIRGEFTFVLLMILLAVFVSWKATLVVFALPFFGSRFGMMAGNWGQHAFVDRRDPANNYLNSITCINHPYNKMCWNDGYHIGHHLRPHMHWTDMPGELLKNKDKYAANDAIVFENIDFTGVWFLLMRKRYDKLASHFVNLGDRYKSDEEVMKMLRSRTQKYESDYVYTPTPA